MVKIFTSGGRHLSHIQPFSLIPYLHRARTFLLLNSFTNIIYGEVLQNSIETKMIEYEVLLNVNDLEMQKRNTNQSAAIN